MSSTIDNGVLNPEQAARMSPNEIVELSRSYATLRDEVAALTHQLEWFKRQLFGQKSERRIVDPASKQMSFGETMNPAQSASAPTPAERRVEAHTRKVATKKADFDEDSVPFFDESRVPVELIEVPSPRDRGAVCRRVRDHRPQGQFSARPASGQLRGAQVPAPGDQAQGEAGHHLSRGPGGGDRVEPRGCELRRRAADRQIRLSPAAVSPAPASDRRRHHGEPAVADAVESARRRPARTDLRGAISFDPRLASEGDG